MSFEDTHDRAHPNELEDIVGRQVTLDRLADLIQSLEPLERQLMLLYLEGVDATSISEITGLSGARRNKPARA